MSDVLGVALLGCGGMGRGLGEQMNNTGKGRILAVADPADDPRATAADMLQAPAFSDAEEAISQPGVEAVIIASPPFMHRPLVEMATAAGKHVFVEKPMAANLPECDAIIAACERAGVTLQVGQVLRYYPCWWQTKQLVDAGEIGAPVGVQVTRTGGGWGPSHPAWRMSLEQSGGLLMEVNSHEIDFMCTLCGDVEKVYAEADHYGPEATDYPDLYFVNLRFTSGAIGNLQSSQIAAIGQLYGTVYGTEGSLVYTGGFAGGTIRYGRRGGDIKEIPIGDIQKENPVAHELRLFAESVREGKPVCVPGSEGKRNVAVAVAAYESARTGQPVRL